MKSDKAVCYVTDKGFLLPSLASALRLRTFVSETVADIFIFTIGIEADLLLRLNRAFNPIGVQLESLTTEDLRRLEETNLKKRQHNYPLAVFGRLFMEEALPASYRHIVYLDGDVWPVEDPSQLILTPVPDGLIAAADDPISYRQRVRWIPASPTIDAYLQGLNIPPQFGYFNSGVLAATREAWREIARDASQFLHRNADLCKGDQSALNAVAYGRRIKLSCRWNFQTQYRVWNADRIVGPRLYHFTRNPKPWQCVLEPWPTLFEDYRQSFADLSEFDLPLVTLSDQQAAAANQAFHRSYAYLRWPAASWTARRMMRFEQSESECWI